MKKFIFISFLICMISGCSYATSTHIIKDKSQLDINPITYSKIQEQMQSKDTFVLYIGRDSCRDCQEFKPILENYLKNEEGTYVYYLDTQEIKKNKAEYDQLKKELDFNWVPTLKLISDGQLEASYQYLDEDYYSLSVKQQKQMKQKYIDDFHQWMNDIFVEE